MQKLFVKFAAVALMFSVFTLTSCEEDPVVVDPVGPSISFVSEAGYLDGDAELFEGESFSVKVSLSQGDEALKTLTIWAGADQLDNNDFTIVGATSNNPLLIVGGGDVTYDITITTKGLVGDVITYAFEVGDEGSRTSEVSLAITTIAPPTTPTNVEYSAIILKNIDGPVGSYGSLDLDTGVTVPSSSTDSDIADKGINNALPAASNWYQQIQPVNGAKMRIPDGSMVENFSFENANTREMLEAAWETTADVNETAVLAEGDVFMALVGEDYYLIEVSNISIDPAANLDSYTLNVKGSKK
jgi:hypothetical protein